MDWGEKVEFLQSIEETTGETPPALANRPALNKWVLNYWAGFHLLNASRPLGPSGVGPIPLSEIVAYCEMFQVDDMDERERFVTMIRALDAAYLKRQAEKREAERKKHGRRN